MFSTSRCVLLMCVFGIQEAQGHGGKQLGITFASSVRTLSQDSPQNMLAQTTQAHIMSCNAIDYIAIPLPVSKVSERASAQNSKSNLGYAKCCLRTTTQVIPELVATSAAVLSREVASHLELIHQDDEARRQAATSSSDNIIGHTATNSSCDNCDGLSSAAPAMAGTGGARRNVHCTQPWSHILDPCTIHELFTVYKRLGFNPGSTCVSSLLVALLPQLQQTTSSHLADILEVGGAVTNSLCWRQCCTHITLQCSTVQYSTLHWH